MQIPIFHVTEFYNKCNDNKGNVSMEQVTLWVSKIMSFTFLEAACMSVERLRLVFNIINDSKIQKLILVFSKANKQK